MGTGRTAQAVPNAAYLWTIFRAFSRQSNGPAGPAPPAPLASATRITWGSDASDTGVEGLETSVTSVPATGRRKNGIAIELNSKREIGPVQFPQLRSAMRGPCQEPNAKGR